MSAFLILWSLIIALTCTQYGSTFEFNFTHPDRSEIHNLNEYCKINLCLVKCCPDKHIMVTDVRYTEVKHSCNSSSQLASKYGVENPDDYSDMEVYNKGIEREIIKTNKSVSDFKFIYHESFIASAKYAGNFEGLPQFSSYVLEDGKWVFRRMNYWHQWTIYEPGYFCIDHEVSLYDDGSLDSTPVIAVWIIDKEIDPTNTRPLIGANAMLVSCFFLLLVLLVYAVLPQLQNLPGMMLMACMVSYMAFFIIRIIQVFANENVAITLRGCSTLTIMFYYLMLATFCWINVMSFDIWWKFRSIRKSYEYRKTPRDTMKKFRRYCAYAWGLPVLPTLFIIIVDLQDLTHIPNFVKPHIFDNACFFEKDIHFLYVGMPILILNCINLTLFVMTAYNIWEVKMSVKRYTDSSSNKKDENRFWMYLKLFTVMGVSWLLEVLSDFFNTESLWWCISDIYNCLVGLLIFILFVCKKKIFLALCTRFSIDNALVQRMHHRAEAQMKSSASQNTDTSDVENWVPTYKGIQSKSTDI